MIKNLVDSEKINNIILAIICLVFFYLIVKDSYKSELKEIFENYNLKRIKLMFSVILLIYNLYDKTSKEKNKSTKTLIKENYSKVTDSLSIAFLFCITLLVVKKPIFYPFIIILLKTYLIKKTDKFNPKYISHYLQIFSLLLPFLTLLFNSISKSKPFINIDKSNIIQHFINLGVGTIIVNKYMNDRDYDLITVAYQIMIYTSLYNYTILGTD